MGFFSWILGRSKKDAAIREAVEAAEQSNAKHTPNVQHDLNSRLTKPEIKPAPKTVKPFESKPSTKGYTVNDRRHSARIDRDDDDDGYTPSSNFKPSSSHHTPSRSWSDPETHWTPASYTPPTPSYSSTSCSSSSSYGSSDSGGSSSSDSGGSSGGCD